MNIEILQLTAGAAQAKGIVVIIDVFRAYTVECQAFRQGIQRIYPVAAIEDALALKAAHADWLLAGERHSRKMPGFDFGNSPYEISLQDLQGKTLIHSTSAGTQGIGAAVWAEEILVGALTNAKANADYIRRRNPAQVSLVCMGQENLYPAEEDTFCAEYMQSLLENRSYDRQAAIEILRKGSGARFFEPENIAFSPPQDFYLATEFDSFPFALKVLRDANGSSYVEKITVN
ncbi:MAG: 2-phosphosulfolactate phosphatase [Negativicutes bacterium]|nr:2-phosphosulfolactate phosphatase [Negativicutes bacterium]